jgi:hypothetical protein
MSSELFLQSYEKGDNQYIPLDHFLSVLSDYKTDRFEASIDVTLTDGVMTLYLDLSSEEISNIMVSRPFVSKELDSILFQMMHLGNFILFSPDASYPILLKEETRGELPDGMADALGKPKIAKDMESFSYLLSHIYDNEC